MQTKNGSKRQHTTSAADQLANQGVQKDEPDNIDLTVPEHFKAVGTRLLTLSQKQAYQAMKSKETKPYTWQTLSNLDITRHAIHDTTGNLETDATLWRSIRHPDIRRPIQAFLYRAMAGSLRIGDFWQKIPNYEQRAICMRCASNQLETLEHILIECDAPERTRIWRLAQNTWPDQNHDIFPKGIGHVLGCGNINSRQQGNRTPTAHERGFARLQRILISESAHLI